MACRDCKWWDLTTLKPRAGVVVAECSFDLDEMRSRLPNNATIEVDDRFVPPLFGEGCPQHAERKEGE